MMTKWIVEQYEGDFFSKNVLAASPAFIASDPVTIFNAIYKSREDLQVIQTRSENFDYLRGYEVRYSLFGKPHIETWRAIQVVDLDEAEVQS